MAKPLTRPTNRSLNESIAACIHNGDRLLDEIYDLEFRAVVATRYYLAMIAQEEFSKAFMLILVRDNAVPFTSEVMRAMRDHTCKQLLGMVMDYVIMHWDEIDQLKAMIERESELDGRFPPDISSAMNILRHEKIGRWESNNWVWAEDPEYDKEALAIAEGDRDRRKQDALYVRVGKDGRPASQPTSITEPECLVERDRASRYSRLVASSLRGAEQSDRFLRVSEAVGMLFEKRK